MEGWGGEINDLAISEDYALPEPKKRPLCDCVLSHNGLGLIGRECDCPASGINTEEENDAFWNFINSIGR